MVEHRTNEQCDLEAIRARDAATLGHHLAGDQALPWKRVLLDRRALLAEIDRLRGELDMAKAMKSLVWSLCQALGVGAEALVAEVKRLRANA